MNDPIALLSVEDTIKNSWEKVKGSKGSFWAAFAISLVVIIVTGLLSDYLKPSAPQVSGLIDFIGQVINYLLQMGILYMGIRRADDLPIDFKMVYRAFDFYLALKIVGLYLLHVLIFIPSIILTVIGMFFLQDHPAIAVLFYILAAIVCAVLAVRIILAMGFVIDKEVMPWPAFVMSFQATRGNFWRILATLFIEILIFMVSLIPLGIGLIWTLPFGFIVYGMMYKQLRVNVK